MSKPLLGMVEAIKAGQKLGPDETLALRRVVWPDGRITPAEADILFELNGLADGRSAEWCDFFVDAMAEYVVRQAEPKGYVSPENAQWLIDHIDHDGHVESLAELELIVKVMELATSVPSRFKRYAMEQIEHCVVTGTGPTRCEGGLTAGSMGEAECKLLRRMLFAQAGDGPAWVSRDEADMLFRIKDAVRDGDNAPQWERLFVQGVANHLQAHNGYEALSRADAERLDSFMNDTSGGIGSFAKRMAMSDIGSSFSRFFGGAKADAQKDDGPDPVDTAETITRDEREWLDARVQADKTFDPLEKALIRALADAEWE